MVQRSDMLVSGVTKEQDYIVKPQSGDWGLVSGEPSYLFEIVVTSKYKPPRLEICPHLG